MRPVRARARVAAEQLISALVPVLLPRPVPVPAPLPALPERRLPDGAGVPALGIARLDRSGRVSARPLLRDLGWRRGHRVDVDVDVPAAVLLVGSSVTGRQVVGDRGELALPAAARQMCGIQARSTVVLAAYPGLALLVVHPAHSVARLLSQHHTRLVDADG
jgi:hypothetical protein